VAGASGASEAAARRAPPLGYPGRAYLTESVCDVVLQKSVPTQARELIVDISNDEG